MEGLGWVLIQYDRTDFNARYTCVLWNFGAFGDWELGKSWTIAQLWSRRVTQISDILTIQSGLFPWCDTKKPSKWSLCIGPFRSHNLNCQVNGDWEHLRGGTVRLGWTWDAMLSFST